MYKHLFSAFTKVPLLLLALAVAVALPFISLPEITKADMNNTRADAWGTLEYSGSSWLSGSGVDVYSNGSSYRVWNPNTNQYDDNYAGSYNCVAAAGHTGSLGCPNNTEPTGVKWQCVELVNRLAMAKGWITTRWPGNGNTLKDSLPAGFTKEDNDHISYINPGDILTFDQAGTTGHAAVINTVGGSIQVVNQNTVAVISTTSITSGSLAAATAHLSSYLTGYTVQAIIHAPTAKLTSSSSLQTPDGILHVFTGNNSGSAWETWWGNGQGPTSTWLADPTGSPITSMSSLYGSNGYMHVFVGLQSGAIYEIWWGNGHGPTPGLLGTPHNGSAVTGMASRFAADGSIHVFSSTKDGYLWDTYWGGGYNLTTRQLANLSGSAVNAIAYLQTSDGYTHVFSGNSTGSVWETWFNNNTSSGSGWLADPDGSAVNGVSTFRTSDGYIHVFAGLQSGAIDEIYFGNGNGPAWDNLTMLNGGGSYATSVSSLDTGDGYLHVFPGISSGSAWEVWWGGGYGPTPSLIYTPDGSMVSSISSMKTSDGYIHVFYTTGAGGVWESSWYSNRQGFTNTKRASM